MNFQNLSRCKCFKCFKVNFEMVQMLQPTPSPRGGEGSPRTPPRPVLELRKPQRYGYASELLLLQTTLKPPRGSRNQTVLRISLVCLFCLVVLVSLVCSVSLKRAAAPPKQSARAERSFIVGVSTTEGKLWKLRREFARANVRRTRQRYNFHN